MNLISFLTELIYPTPRICPLCSTKQKKLQICSTCREKLNKVKKSWGQCKRCGTFGVHAQVCDNCRSWPKYLVVNYAVVPYKEEYKELLHSFKFYKQGWLASSLVEMMLEELPTFDFDVLISVPLHKNRLHERGFNQSDLLAKNLASKLEKDYLSNLLLRQANTPHQTGLNKNQRRTNLAGAFKVANNINQVKDKRVLLIDDVITSGATLYECAKTLKQAGAKNITCVTYAAGVI